MDAIEVSGAHCRNQLNAIGDFTDGLVDLARKMRSIFIVPSEREGA
jgi:hypothetical protein